jgi:hypothetical protein
VARQSHAASEHGSGVMGALDADTLDWPHQVRACARRDCGETFPPQRKGQVFCSKRCRDTVAQRRARSADIGSDVYPHTEALTRSETAPSGALSRPLRRWPGVPDTWDDWHGRLRLHPMHETPHIGCGERGHSHYPCRQVASPARREDGAEARGQGAEIMSHPPPHLTSGTEPKEVRAI